VKYDVTETMWKEAVAFHLKVHTIPASAWWNWVELRKFQDIATDFRTKNLTQNPPNTVQKY